MPSRALVVLAFALAAMLAAACGTSAVADSETAVEARAADASTAAPEPAPDEQPAETAAEAATETAAATEAPGNAAAWAAIDQGAHAFAARMDAADQAIASCQTDAAEGADFDACVNRSYLEVADAATAFAETIDGAGPTDGECTTAVGELRDAVQAMADDNARAAQMKDRTSRETLQARLGDDAQSYVDAALAAATACEA